MTDSMGRADCDRYPDSCEDDCCLEQCRAHPNHESPPAPIGYPEWAEQQRERMHLQWQRQDLIAEIKAVDEEAELESLRRQWRRMVDLDELKALPIEQPTRPVWGLQRLTPRKWHRPSLDHVLLTGQFHTMDSRNIPFTPLCGPILELPLIITLFKDVHNAEDD